MNRARHCTFKVDDMTSRGTDDLETIKMRWRYAGVLSQQNEGNHTEAVATLEDVVRRCRRILGNQHPLTARAQNMLELSRRGTK